MFVNLFMLSGGACIVFPLKEQLLSKKLALKMIVLSYRGEIFPSKPCKSEALLLVFSPLLYRRVNVFFIVSNIFSLPCFVAQ